MSVGIGKTISVLNEIGSTITSVDGLLKAADSICTLNTVNPVVPTCSDLPVASVSKGCRFFVQSLSAYRYSNGAEWTNCYDSNAKIRTLWTWGNSLADGTTVNKSSPVTAVGTNSGWCQLGKLYSNGGYVAIKTDGTLWSWGLGTNGILGDGTTVAKSSPVTTSGGGTSWCQASSGIAIKTDGTLWTWGNNNSGQLGDNSTVNKSSPVTTLGGGNNWCAVGSYSAIKSDGTLWNWGNNSLGALGDGTTINKSSPVTTAGGGTNWCQVTYTAAIKTDGTLWTWGSNTCGWLGDGTTLNKSSPGTISGGGTNWCFIVYGLNTMSAIKTDGTLWKWGSGASGILGDGTTVPKSSPVTTSGGGTSWCKVTVGVNSNTVALKTDGTIWSWGGNASGGLADGTTVNKSSPVTLSGSGGKVWMDIGRNSALTYQCGF
jgi:hypothetical protein